MNAHAASYIATISWHGNLKTWWIHLHPVISVNSVNSSSSCFPPDATWSSFNGWDHLVVTSSACVFCLFLFTTHVKLNQTSAFKKVPSFFGRLQLFSWGIHIIKSFWTKNPVEFLLIVRQSLTRNWVFTRSLGKWEERGGTNRNKHARWFFERTNKF